MDHAPIMHHRRPRRYRGDDPGLPSGARYSSPPSDRNPPRGPSQPVSKAPLAGPPGQPASVVSKTCNKLSGPSAHPTTHPLLYPIVPPTRPTPVLGHVSATATCATIRGARAGAGKIHVSDSRTPSSEAAHSASTLSPLPRAPPPPRRPTPARGVQYSSLSDGAHAALQRRRRRRGRQLGGSAHGF